MRNRLWTTIVGAVAAIAIGATCTSAAFPAFAAQGIAGTVTDTGAQSSSNVKTNGQPDSADQGDSSITDDSTVSGSNADSQSDAGSASTAPKAEAEGQDSCDNVLTWGKLAECVSGETSQSQTVIIAQTIPVPETAKNPIIINRAITLTAKSGVDPALTSQTNGNAIFNVADGASLTIGTDTDTKDANFSYKNGKRFLVFLQNGGKLTVNNGMFSGIDTTRSTDHDMGTLAYSAGGTVTINGGKFTNNKATRGGVLYSQSGDVSVHGGEFDSNTSKMAAGVIMQDSENNEMTVDGGKFTNNAAGSSGGAIHSNGKLFVKGGEFTGNKTYGGDGQGGGAISQDKGTTTITGGTFISNVQTFGNVEDRTTVECTNDNPGNCRKTAGGGAIRIDGGTLIIEGAVTFSGNYSRAYGWGMGGGAIYVQGKLYVRNDSRGNKPKFDHNWSGIYDTQYVKDANDKEQVPNGGAGGAIFLQDGGSVAYLMGGSFTNNSSGYLGGAIYTEVGTTTYVAKAVAYDNIAGHFGGGLWLCPSGVGEASKGGNIALFDNAVDNTIDSNDENLKPATLTDQEVPEGTTVDGTEAGADFAIMNPRSKNHDDTSFMLMDTWFTDRTESAVTWYRDGIPLMDASGFADAYQQRTSDSQPSGQSLAVTKSGGRYNANDQKSNVKIEDNAYTDHVKNLTLGWNGTADGKQEEFHDRGVALKAVVKGDAEEQASRKSAAKSAAAVEISGNKARLSGGGFGTNGNVKFSSPYTASWSKVKNTVNVDGTVTTPTKADKANQLAGSSWLITTTPTKMNVKQDGSTETNQETITGGPFDLNFYPKVCTAEQLNAGDWENGRCWKEETNDNGNVTKRSAIVKDNTANDANGNKAYAGFDNNPNGGAFDINNLADGTYTMTEYQAPAGYVTSSDKYTFVVNGSQAQWQKADGTDAGIEQIIGNTPMPGVSWSKMDGDHPTEAVKNTEWKITPINNNGDGNNNTGYTVTDCVTEKTAGVACDSDQNANDLTNHVLADRNPDEGVFTLENLTNGQYKLEESETPDGYWTSNRMTGTSYYWFEIKTGTKTAPLMYHDGTATDPDNADVEVKNKTIINQKPDVLWSKVDANNVDGDALAGSEWTIRGPLTENGEDVTVDGKTLTVTAPVTDCKSENAADQPCSSDRNAVNDNTGVITAYADLDNASGRFKVSGLVPAPDAQTTYMYELTETKAPEGYLLSKHTYRFTIGHSQPTAAVSICQLDSSVISKVMNAGGTACSTITDNKIPNSKPVNSLPLTGGDARSWLFIGSGLALAAALAALATGRVKRHEL